MKKLLLCDAGHNFWSIWLLGFVLLFSIMIVVIALLIRAGFPF